MSVPPQTTSTLSKDSVFLPISTWYRNSEAALGWTRLPPRTRGRPGRLAQKRGKCSIIAARLDRWQASCIITYNTSKAFPEPAANIAVSKCYFLIRQKSQCLAILHNSPTTHKPLVMSEDVYFLPTEFVIGKA